MAREKLKIGIAGLGTVGVGVFKILTEKSELIADRAGRNVEIAAVSSRDQNKDRGVNLDGVKWYEDALELAGDENLDVVVELIGGADGVAYELAKKSLENGKSFVTANKALIAAHGFELAELAEKQNVALSFEAAVAGGIPVIGAIKQGLSGNQIAKVSGIMNGTCNYILTAMQKDKRDFAEALKEAQELGYAEADPTFDVDGIDTAHKLAILTSLAFCCQPAPDDMHIEGIRNVTVSDIEYAEELGYKIKLLGVAEQNEKGISQRVHPCLVRKESPISQVDGVINAVAIESDALGPLLLEGAGAGEKPTASSVVADLVDVAADRRFLPFGIPAGKLGKVKFVPMDEHVGEYYLRLSVKDEPGVLAAITSALSAEGIGVEQVLQPSTKQDKTADIIITTHQTTDKAIENVMVAISKMGDIIDPPYVIRIEN